ncbi:NUDIX hydrolase [Kitasatospora sp. NPDC097643]|uniref:NUDIX hydrolase n=1 Tax=Kitasatospora sp. NPDC097643 TaxID=3157230 RepID=UPI003330C160
MITLKFLADQAIAEGFDKLAAGTVVLDTEGRVLLLRRRADDVLPGLWDYPAGGLEPGEDPLIGAVRELYEETGLRRSDLDTDLAYVRALDFVNTRGRRTRQFVFTATVPAGTQVRLAEHDAATWAEPDRLPPTSDGYREVLDHLLRLRTRPRWQPVGSYVQGLAGFTAYGCFYVTDEDDRPLCLRSALNPEDWQWPGGDTDPGETPWDTALREFREELGFDLAEVNPEIVDERRLLAVVHLDPTPQWPTQKVGHIFHGGRLTREQLDRIVLDPAEHTTWDVDSLHGWSGRMRPADYLRLMQTDRARRSGQTLVVERSDQGALDRHGAPRDFEGVTVFVTDPDRTRLLLNLRDDRPDIAYPAMWTPIGGWREGRENAFEAGAREVLEEAGIHIRDLRTIPGPRHESLHETNVPLHAVFDGTDADLVLGEGQAVRLVPLAEVASLDVPPYLDHYLRLLEA